MSWSHAFEDPIPLPDGGTIRTLRQAGVYILALPPGEAETARWQLALHCLIAAAEGREPVMHARIGMLRALNHGKAKPVPTSRGKPVKSYRLIR